MGKPLDNRQRVKNPKKRDRFTASRKSFDTAEDKRLRRKHLERLQTGAASSKNKD